MRKFFKRIRKRKSVEAEEASQAAPRLRSNLALNKKTAVVALSVALLTALAVVFAGVVPFSGPKEVPTPPANLFSKSSKHGPAVPANASPDRSVAKMVQKEQSPPAAGPEKPVAPRDGEKPEGAVQMGRKLYDLQYLLELKKLQLDLAKTEAQIAEKNLAKTEATIAEKQKRESIVSDFDLAKNEKAGANRGPGARIIASLAEIPVDGGEEPSKLEKIATMKLTAISHDGAMINGRLVRVGGTVSGMKVVSIDAKSETVTLQSGYSSLSLTM